MPRARSSPPLDALAPGQEADIFIGDLVRAFAELAPADQEARSAIIELLGLKPAKPPPVTTELRPPVVLPPRTPRDKRLPPELPPEHLPEQVPAGEGVPSVLEKAAESTAVPSPVEALPATAGDQSPVRPELLPLFLPRWTRAILSAALATNGADGPLDLELLVEMIARREQLEFLPRLPAPTLRRGVQLLIDQSKAMTPFTRDQEWFQEQVKLVAGKEAVETRWFVGCPTRVDGLGEQGAYVYPHRGTVLLLLTDLGIGKPMFVNQAADVNEWLAFASGARKAGCPVIALVPYASRRWPSGLAKAMKIVEWDRRTTVARVKRLVPYGHEVMR